MRHLSSTIIGVLLVIVTPHCFAAEPVKQTASAYGPCGVAINAAGNAQVTVNNNCDARTAATVQKLLDQMLAQENLARRQGSQIRELQSAAKYRGLEAEELGKQVVELAAAVRNVNAVAARQQASAADRQAAALLAQGDASAAIDLLGREAERANLEGATGRQEVAALYRQQAALARIRDLKLFNELWNSKIELWEGLPEAISAAISRCLRPNFSPSSPTYCNVFSDSLDRITAAVGQDFEQLVALQAQISLDEDSAGIRPALLEVSAVTRKLRTTYTIVDSGGRPRESIRELSGEFRTRVGKLHSALTDTRPNLQAPDAGFLGRRPDVRAQPYWEWNSRDGWNQAIRDHLYEGLIVLSSLPIPTDQLAQLEVFEASWTYGDSLISVRNDFEAALPAFERAIEIGRKLLAGGNQDMERNLGLLTLQRGRVFWGTEKHDKALASFLEGVSTLRKITARAQSTEALGDLLYGLNLLGGFAMEQSNIELASKSSTEAVGVGVKLVQQAPDNGSFNAGLLNAYLRLSDLELQRGNANLAKGYVHQAEPLLERLLKLHDQGANAYQERVEKLRKQLRAGGR